MTLFSQVCALINENSGDGLYNLYGLLSHLQSAQSMGLFCSVSNKNDQGEVCVVFCCSYKQHDSGDHGSNVGGVMVGDSECHACLRSQ